MLNNPEEHHQKHWACKVTKPHHLERTKMACISKQFRSQDWSAVSSNPDSGWGTRRKIRPLKASKRKRVRPYPSPVAEENAVRVRGPSLVSSLHVGRSVDTHVHHPSHWKHHTRQVVRVRMGTAQNALPSRTICRSSAHSDNWQILALQFLPWLSSHPSRLIPC